LDIDPHARIEHVIQNHLPTCFHDVSYVYQWSASAGKCHDGGFRRFDQQWDILSVHLWFLSEQKFTDAQLREWGKAIPIIDRAMFLSTQVNYTASPIFEDGAKDVLGVERVGLIKKSADTIQIIENMPTLEELKKIKYLRLNKPYREKHNNNYDNNIGGNFWKLFDSIGNPNCNTPIYSTMMSFIAQTSSDCDRFWLYEKIIEKLSSVDAARRKRYSSIEYLDKQWLSASKVATHRIDGPKKIPENTEELLTEKIEIIKIRKMKGK
jgi:hypothetical protein